MPRSRHRGRGSSGPVLMGVAIACIGFLLVGAGLFAPAEAASMLSMFSTAGVPRTEVFFTSTSGFAVPLVYAYDYQRDVAYSTSSGHLSLPHGSYIVKSPGFEPIVLHLYETGDREVVELEPLPLEVAVADIVSDPATMSMSVIDVANPMFFSVFVREADVEGLARQYSDRTGREAIASPCAIENIGLQFAPGLAIDGTTPEGINYRHCPGRGIYVVKIGVVVFYFSEQAFQSFRQAVAEAQADTQRQINEEIQRLRSLAGRKTITIKAYEGVELELTPTMVDYPVQTYKTLITTDKEVSGVNVEVLLVNMETRKKWEGGIIVLKQSTTTPGNIEFEWPRGPSTVGGFPSLTREERPDVPPSELQMAVKAQPPAGYSLSKIKTDGYHPMLAMTQLYPGYNEYSEIRIGRQKFMVTIYVWPSDKDPTAHALKTCTISGRLAVYERGSEVTDPSSLPAVEGAVVSLMVRRGFGSSQQIELRTAKTEADGSFSFTLRVPVVKRDTWPEYPLYVGGLRAGLKLNARTCEVVQSGNGNYLKFFGNNPITVAVESTAAHALRLIPYWNPQRVRIVGDVTYSDENGWREQVNKLSPNIAVTATQTQTQTQTQATTATAMGATTTKTTTSDTRTIVTAMHVSQIRTVTVRGPATTTAFTVTARLSAQDPIRTVRNPDGTAMPVLQGVPNTTPLKNNPSTADLRPVGRDSNMLVGLGVVAILLGLSMAAISFFSSASRGRR